jgi:hypothetical protein
MNILRHIFAVLVACAGLLAQSAPKTAPPAATHSPAPASITIGEESYPFPLQERDKIRDQQHEYDQIEIENQKMLLKIEQNKARQAAVMDAIRLTAFQFAQTKKINLDLYELDPAPISFVKKKSTKP